MPKEVIVTRDGKSIVFEVRDGKAVARAIVTGLERGGQIVVRDGLAGGETLVRQPPETLKDGDAVKVKG